MSTQGLHQLVGKAVTNKSFRHGLLNGERAQLLGEFNLTPAEVAAVLAIRAVTLRELAGAVERLCAPVVGECHCEPRSGEAIATSWREIASGAARPRND